MSYSYFETEEAALASVREVALLPEFQSWQPVTYQVQPRELIRGDLRSWNWKLEIATGPWGQRYCLTRQGEASFSLVSRGPCRFRVKHTDPVGAFRAAVETVRRQADTLSRLWVEGAQRLAGQQPPTTRIPLWDRLR